MLRLLPRPMPGTTATRPGRVKALRGVIFQSDARSTIGALFIRPFEALDRALAGLRPASNSPPLAMHAGLHVVLDDGREFVAEQLVGSAYEDFASGLNWTPLDQFRERDRGGWDVTVPATAFRGVDEQIVDQTVDRLNSIKGHPFLGEDCTAFVERAFGVRQLFADSPTLRALGIRGQLGDPAMPLLRPDVPLDARTKQLLRADALYALPDPGTGSELHAARMWGGRLLFAIALASSTAILVRASRRTWSWRR